MDNSKRSSGSGRKTNNSQSAGMTKGSSNKTSFGTTDTPRGKEVALETNTQNVFTPGTPDIPEGLDIPEISSFQTAQEQDRLTPIDRQATVAETIDPDYPDIEDLVEMGVPFGREDLPDRGAYKEVIVEFPACMPFSSFGESITDTGLDRSEKIFALAGRHRQALQLGETALRRPIYSSYDKVVSRKGRKDLFKEEMEILRELLTNLYYFNNGTNQVGYALQKIILVSLNHRLKLRRSEAEESLIVSGEGIPPLPRWGLNGKADEFWTGNDFEILGACYRREVENFLAYLAEHHDFSKGEGKRQQDRRVVLQNNPHRKSVINPPTVTAVRDYQPSFLEGEPDSISVHLRKSRARVSVPVSNINTSVFGHPVQNSSSRAIKELFGVTRAKNPGELATFNSADKFNVTHPQHGSTSNSQIGDNESDDSRSHKSGEQAHFVRRGGGDPGDSDGNDSDGGGGNKGPHRGPRKPLSPNGSRKNPFDANSEELKQP